MIEVLEGKAVEVGGLPVVRVLPKRPRRTVGAWCFADHLGPSTSPMDIGPHPHIGLQTVTWLLDGAVLHRDSLGSEQLVRPGQLNLMTAGGGVAHSEEGTGVSTGRLHGIQLWVAQPEATRHGGAAFEHHPSLPQVDLDGGGSASVLVGCFGGVESPARRDTDHMGVDLDLAAGRHELALDVSYEHGLVAMTGPAGAAGTRLDPGRLVVLPPATSSVVVECRERVRVVLIGGVPFAERLHMWWNYVARSRDEITAAHRAWVAGDARFGEVASPLGRIVVGGPPW